MEDGSQKNVKRYLQLIPSVEEMKVLLHPIYYRYTYRPNNYKPMFGCIPDSDMKHVSTIVPNIERISHRCLL